MVTVGITLRNSKSGTPDSYSLVAEYAGGIERHPAPEWQAASSKAEAIANGGSFTTVNVDMGKWEGMFTLQIKIYEGLQSQTLMTWIDRMEDIVPLWWAYGDIFLDWDGGSDTENALKVAVVELYIDRDAVTPKEATVTITMLYAQVYSIP